MNSKDIMCKCGHSLNEHRDYHGEQSYCHGGDCECDGFVCDAVPMTPEQLADAIASGSVPDKPVQLIAPTPPEDPRKPRKE